MPRVDAQRPSEECQECKNGWRSRMFGVTLKHRHVFRLTEAEAEGEIEGAIVLQKGH